MSTLSQIINERINKDLDMYTYEPEKFEIIEDLLKNQKELDFDRKLFMDSVFKIKIINNRVYTYYNQNDFIDRKKEITLLIKESIKYMKEKGKNFPNTILYISVQDGYPYFYQDLPFFCCGKPDNEAGILIPDNTFISNNIEEKKYNWDDTKKIIFEKCENIDKENKIYFKGVNSGKLKHNFRGSLAKDSKNIKKIPLEVILNNSIEPMYNFCKNKYLLNLPGNAPWSYRFKYLFLMKSLVINISLKYKYRTINNGKWVSFFDKYFIPGEDFVEIEYIWGPKQTKEEKKLEYKKILNKLEKTYKYYEKNPEKYKIMVNNGYKKINNITQEIVYTSIYKLLWEYTDRINKSQ